MIFSLNPGPYLIECTITTVRYPQPTIEKKKKFNFACLCFMYEKKNRWAKIQEQVRGNLWYNQIIQYSPKTKQVSN